MRWIIIILLALVGLLQYKLWFQEGGIKQAAKLDQQVRQQAEANEQLMNQNKQLQEEIKDLKHGSEAIEERARTELGMVKANEEYVQVVEAKHR